MLTEENINTLLDNLFKPYGYDFNFYSRDSLRRRINKLLIREKFSSFDSLISRIKTDESYIHHLVDQITVNVTEMFRDPQVFMRLREEVIPALRNLPKISIWHAGCSSGEEAISTAILLHEADLLHKTQIMATDINPLVIEKAKKASYRSSLIPLYERNYKAAGGTLDFNFFFEDEDKSGTKKIKPFLSEHISFITSNLASLNYFNKFHLIVCRNVVIYFDKELRERVFQLFDASMYPNAYLVLGEKETVHSSGIAAQIVQTGKEKIWKKI